MNKKLRNLNLKHTAQTRLLQNHVKKCLYCSKTGLSKPFGKKHCGTYWTLCDALDKMEDSIFELEDE